MMNWKIIRQIFLQLLVCAAFISVSTVNAWGLSYIYGYVWGVSNEPIEGALIDSGTGVTSYSFSDGYYLIAVPAGTYVVTVSSYGYQTQQIENVVVNEGSSTYLGINLNVADLKLEAVYPTLGELGENLEVTLTGSAFDEDTRVSVFPDVGNNRAIIGDLDTTYASDIALSGTTAYIADGTGGLRIVDINDPSQPQQIGHLPGIEAHGVVISGTTAFLSGGGFFYVVDVSNPSAINVLDSVDLPGEESWGIALLDTTAYVACDINGIQIVDVSVLSSATIIGAYVLPPEPPYNSIGEAYDVAVAGDLAYVAYNYYGIQIINVANPSSTFREGSIKLGAYHNGVVLEGSIAYVSHSYTGVSAVDISNPSVPFELDTIDLPGYALDVSKSADYLYVSDGSAGLQIINAKNPSALTHIGSVNTPGDANGAAVSGTTVFVVDRYTGLQVIDASKPSTFYLGYTHTSTWAEEIAIAGDYAYVAEVGALAPGFTVFDISDPSAPLVVDEIDYGYVYGIDIQDSYAYVSSHAGTYYSKMGVFDISDPSEPQEVGLLEDTLGSAGKISVSGTIAGIANGVDLKIIDISDPTEPTIRSTYDPDPVSTSSVYGVAVSGNTACITGNSDTGLRVLDITDPSNPSASTKVDVGQAEAVAISGDYAYVGGSSKLMVVDINPSHTNPPTYLTIVGEVTLPSFVRDIFLLEDRAYVAVGDEGIQIIDINDSTSPTIIGSVGTFTEANGVAVSGNAAYIADYYQNFVILPVPVEISSVTVNSDSEISLTIPAPNVSGPYTMRVFNTDQYDELFGAVTFTSNLSTLNSKAIIVAGGGPNAPGGIWEETKIAANKAYDVLIQQGYDHDSIKYLSLETNNQYVDNAALDVFLYDAIINWASDASELLIYLVDHGEIDQFILYASGTYTQKLSAQELDGWLDDLQNGGMDGPVTVVYDACQSGSFVTRLLPPIGKEDDRIVLTSASNEPAYFLEQGVESFSFQFWDRILWNEGNLGNAFSNAKELMKGYQTALIDANGNGVSNESEDLTRAGSSIIRRGSPTYITVKPEIDNVTVGDSVLNGSTSTIIFATGVVDADSVWAQIIPPDVNPATSSIPITDLPSVELTDGDHDDIYDATYNGFDTEGTYVIIVKALATQEVYSYVAGENTVQNFYSLPVYASVTQSSGVENIEEDSYEEDDSPAQASVIFVNDKNLQAHNFHDTGDEDWVQFFAAAGKTYKIKTSNLSVVTDTIIEVFNGDETPRPEGPYNAAGAGEDEFTDWYCPANGLYYVKVSNNLTTFGENVRYDLSIYLPVGGGESIAGRVVDTSATPAGIGGVKIEACIGSPSVCETTYTLDNINYLGVFTYGYLVDGTYTLTATKQGYATQIVSVNVGDGGGDGLAVPDIIMPLADTDPPTATVSYSNTNPTNQNVVATLHPSETVTVTNNSGSLIYTFTANGTFTFEFEDSAGNTGTATATVSNIDKTPPTYSIAYTPDTLTNQDVVATLQPSEAVTVTNNGGLLTRTFTTNGSFTFEFADGAGNTGTAVASVNWIDKTPAVVSISYSISVPTTQDVVATLIPEEAVILTNNGGSTVRTFTTNGSFTFEFTDGAGNTGTAVALVNWIDRTPPTATIAYSTTAPTNQNVVATLQPSETVTVTNNSGLLSYTFFDNGTFTFEFEDAAGNTGSATATVDNIDHTLRNKGMPWLYLLLEEEN